MVLSVINNVLKLSSRIVKINFTNSFQQPVRCRSFIHPRTVVDSFSSRNEYKEKHNQKKIKKQRNALKVKQEIDHGKEEHDQLNFEVSQEIRQLKYKAPNPGKVGEFSKLMMNLKSKRYRERHSSCLLEGHFLIKDAMESGLFIRTVFFTRMRNLEGLPLDILKKTNLVKVEMDDIQFATEV